jgi:hypothetical protein
MTCYLAVSGAEATAPVTLAWTRFLVGVSTEQAATRSKAAVPIPPRLSEERHASSLGSPLSGAAPRGEQHHKGVARLN